MIMELTKSNTFTNAYPNPATYYVTFEYEIPQFVESAELIITNITGNVMKHVKIHEETGQELWDTRNVQNGLYFYVLRDKKGNTLISGKISILK